MKATYVSIVFLNKESAKRNLDTLQEKAVNVAKSSGRELLILVPECGGLGFSLNQLRSWLTSPAKVGIFNLEHYPSGRSYRFWYQL